MADSGENTGGKRLSVLALVGMCVAGIGGMASAGLIPEFRDLQTRSEFREVLEASERKNDEAHRAIQEENRKTLETIQKALDNNLREQRELSEKQDRRLDKLSDRVWATYEAVRRNR